MYVFMPEFETCFVLWQDAPQTLTEPWKLSVMLSLYYFGNSLATVFINQILCNPIMCQAFLITLLVALVGI
jgi:hypothetical protein